MNLTIIGTGNVGSALGKLWAAKGYAITYVSRDPKSSKVQQLLKETGHGAKGAAHRDAASAAEVVVLATPWEGTKNAIEACGNLSGKTLIDATNPLKPGSFDLAVGFDTSGAEQVAEWARGAKVIKDFNTLGADLYATPRINGQQASMFLCGDDAGAKATATRLTEDLGFEAIDCGPLTSSRLLEPMCALWLKLAPKNDWRIAWKVLKP
jgi:predicted dinucleotide-binding enzyme